MKEIVHDLSLLAKCGLYCGACPRYLKEKCSGCSENHSAKWCKLRTCCIEKNIKTCAECDEFQDVMQCKKYNTFMAKIFGFIFNSNRSACVQSIKDMGMDGFISERVKTGTMTIKRK